MPNYWFSLLLFSIPFSVQILKQNFDISSKMVKNCQLYRSYELIMNDTDALSLRLLPTNLKKLPVNFQLGLINAL